MAEPNADMADACAAPVLVDRDGAIATVIMNRPRRLNATNDALGVALENAFIALAADRAVRVIVLTGAGGNFCAGGDIDRLREIYETGGDAVPGVPPGTDDPRFATLTAPRALRSRYLLPAAMPQPVIAAIDGACAGAGLVLAASCDVRIAGPRARFTAAFGKRGLIAENGLAWTLPRLVGHGAASDMLLSGRKVDAGEALRLGLVTAVAEGGDPLADALRYARILASDVSPRAATVIKRQLLGGDLAALEAAQALAWDEMMTSFRTADFAEGIASFVEKRPARFPDRGHDL